MQSNRLIYYDCQQVIKNLLFVAKVIYLISPETDTEENGKEGVKDAVEKTDEEKEHGGEDQDDEEEEPQQQEIIEEQDKEEEHQKEQIMEEQDENRPPSLVWVIKKLTLLAKREAANTPKVPVKVSC